MSTAGELGQIGVVAAVEYLVGGATGAIIDAAFPDASPDAPLLVQAAEILGETAVMGMALSVMGKYIVRQLNPGNATGGFLFFLGMTSGIGNFRVKSEVLMAKLKLLSADAFNSATGSAREVVMEKMEQKAPPSQ